MGLFNNLFKKEQSTQNKNQNFKQLGFPGVEFYSGIIKNFEYVPKLEGINGLEVFNEMRMSDATVKSILNSIKLPIRAADWFIEPGSDSPEDMDIAEIIENNLKHQMTITWDDFLRQALTELDFGFSIFEKVWHREENGLILLKKLAPRIQTTLWKWYTDENGSLTGIQQWVQTGAKSKGGGNAGTGTFVYVDIPIEKLVVFVNDMEGNNFQGTSLLRHAYRNWYIKNQLLKMDAIMHERSAAGMFVYSHPEKPNQEDKDNMPTILENLHSRERSYVIKPSGSELEFLQGNNNDSIINSIKFHSTEMTRAMLNDFIMLGSTDSGSRALSKSKEELFLMSINAVADHFTDYMNRYVIKQIVDLNWEVEEYPKLMHSKIILDTNAFLEKVNSLIGTSITKDIEIENRVRKLVGFPDMLEEELPEEPQQDVANDAVIEDDTDVKEETQEKEEKELHEVKLNEKKRSREVTLLEKTICDIDGIETSLNESEVRFESIIRRIRKEMISNVARQVVKKQPEDVKAPLMGKLADRILNESKRMIQRGKAHVNEEIERQKKEANKQFQEKPKKIKDPLNDKQVDDNMKSSSKASAVEVGNEVVSSALNAFYNRSDSGQTDEEIISDIETEVATTGNRVIKAVAAGATMKAYNMGRTLGGGENQDVIEYAVRSAILDGAVCDTCLPKDGVRHELGDPRYVTPDPKCFGAFSGGNSCRCVNIYKIEGVTGPFVTKPQSEQFAEEKALKVIAASTGINKAKARRELIAESRIKYGM